MYISMYVCICTTDICIHILIYVCIFMFAEFCIDITETIKIIFCEINIYIEFLYVYKFI